MDQVPQSAHQQHQQHRQELGQLLLQQRHQDSHCPQDLHTHGHSGSLQMLQALVALSGLPGKQLLGVMQHDLT